MKKERGERREERGERSESPMTFILIIHKV